MASGAREQPDIASCGDVW